MHEVRSSFKEWNFCWARLRYPFLRDEMQLDYAFDCYSVYWTVLEIAHDYAHQMDDHVTYLLRFLHQRHWRTNPLTLCGMRVAVFRKNPSPVPTVVLGRVVEPVVKPAPAASAQAPCGSVTGSMSSNTITERDKPDRAMNAAKDVCKVRVLFDEVSGNSGSKLGPLCSPTVSPGTSKPPGNLSVGSLQGFTSTGGVISEVVEPFWVQPLSAESGSENGGSARGSISQSAAWFEPDEYCAQEIRKELSAADIRVFWEMVRVMIELEEFRGMLKGPLASMESVTAIVIRKENSLLWTADAAQYIPKECATVLMTESYLVKE
jgi:hypothetical protein